MSNLDKSIDNLLQALKIVEAEIRDYQQNNNRLTIDDASMLDMVADGCSIFAHNTQVLYNKIEVDDDEI